MKARQADRHLIGVLMKSMTETRLKRAASGGISIQAAWQF
jgi:hypothetical protein